jgi:hypothetical protein
MERGEGWQQQQSRYGRSCWAELESRNCAVTMSGSRSVLMPYKAERTMKSITPTAINDSPIARGAAST